MKDMEVWGESWMEGGEEAEAETLEVHQREDGMGGESLLGGQKLARVGCWWRGEERERGCQTSIGKTDKPILVISLARKD